MLERSALDAAAIAIGLFRRFCAMSRVAEMSEFIAQFGQSLFPDFGDSDGGTVYLHRRRAWLDMC